MTTSLGERLREARAAQGISQQEMAWQLRSYLPVTLKVDPSTISRIETGAIKHAEPYLVAAMAKVLQTPLAELAPEYVDEIRALLELISGLDTSGDDPGGVTIRNRRLTRLRAAHPVAA